MYINHGLAISKDGRTIYASTIKEVFSWSYDPKKPRLDIDTSRVLIKNMENGGHISRTLLLSQKYPDMLLVSRGSNGKDDEGATERANGRSQIRAFNISSFANDSTTEPYDYLSGKLLGWGLCNPVALAEHPETGGIFSLDNVNSVDELHRAKKDIHKDNPAEEMNFHGFLDGSTEKQGGNYGYPVCYTLWSTDKFPNLGDLKAGDQFAADRKTKGDSLRTDKECKRDYVGPELAFQANMAPLDMKFDENGTKVYISFHGSWNRKPPVGYQVSAVNFASGHPTSPITQTRNALLPALIRNKNLNDCPDDCFRPVGLAWDSKGRLFFSSDKTGEIFVVSQKSNQNSTAGKKSD
ncbi:hypothetical protein IL306_005851 [Fusarium sp. DS 682]|nr:hypothetical protein IL306_005851 [Fusarium sp. DS 682]